MINELFEHVLCTLCDKKIEVGKPMELICHRCIAKAEIGFTSDEIRDLIALLNGKFKAGFDNFQLPIDYAKKYLVIYDKLCAADSSGLGYTIIKVQR